MSHPTENTLKNIIEKRDEQIKILMDVIYSHEKKFKALIKTFELYVSTMYSQQGDINMEQSKRFLEMLDEVRKL